MKTVIKEQWVAALRSGDYKQGAGALNREEEDDPKDICFCCLGVLTDLYAQEKGKPFNCNDDLRTVDNEEFLCEGVIKWAGLISKDPEVNIDDDSLDSVKRTLSGCNDSGLTFSEIADLIEKQL